MSSRTLLVTGASGDLGRAVLARLADHWTVRALVHRRPVPAADEQCAGSLADPTALRAATDGADAVLHLAAVTHARSSRAYEEVNVHGTRRLLEACQRQGVARFVHVSTRALSPDGGHYSVSKLRAEAAVRGSGVASVIVRLPEVYGGGGREGVDRIIQQARADAAILLVGRGDDIVCPIAVDDAVLALVAALDAPAAIGHTYTLAGTCIPMREFAHECRKAFGTSSRIVGVPITAVRLLAAAGRVLPLPVYPDQLARLRAAKPAPSAEAADDLGFAPRSLRHGLAALI
jgi:nucleoside-diphosphate-sugar epimerase